MAEPIVPGYMNEDYRRLRAHLNSASENTKEAAGSVYARGYHEIPRQGFSR